MGKLKEQPNQLKRIVNLTEKDFTEQTEQATDRALHLVWSIEYRAFMGEWTSRLRQCDRIRRFPVQTPLCCQPDLGTEPHYKAPSDL